MVSWEKVCMGKVQGGLGVRMASLMNNAYLMKLAWEVFCDCRKLWVDVMKSKYSFSNNGKTSRNGSGVEGPMSLKEFVKYGI